MKGYHFCIEEPDVITTSGDILPFALINELPLKENKQTRKSKIMYQAINLLRQLHVAISHEGFQEQKLIFHIFYF